jgi:hypothetical protein
MKKILTALVLTTSLLASCSSSIVELNSLIKRTLTYQEARTKVQLSEKLPVSSSVNGKLSRNTVDPVTRYFLLKYQSVTLNYEIKTLNETINAQFEIRGEVFLNALEANQVSVTASMPVIKYLFISTTELSNMESMNQEWLDSPEFLIAPFTTKYRYGETTNHFGFEIKDFSSTGGGLITTLTSNEFSYSNEDNKLTEWQFQFWNKDETTSGTNTIYKTVSVRFEWLARDA